MWDTKSQSQASLISFYDIFLLLLLLSQIHLLLLRCLDSHAFKTLPSGWTVPRKHRPPLFKILQKSKPLLSSVNEAKKSWCLMMPQVPRNEKQKQSISYLVSRVYQSWKVSSIPDRSHDQITKGKKEAYYSYYIQSSGIHLVERPRGPRLIINYSKLETRRPISSSVFFWFNG